MKTPPCVLTIAGSDSGAGAGVQADARTIHAMGGYALTAITAITAQNTRGVQHWSPVSAGMLVAQLTSVLDDFAVAAVKTGLLPGTAAIHAIASALARNPRIPLVIDPVIGSTSGTRFLSAAGLRVLQRELLPRAALITPNWPEAEALSGRSIRTFAEAEAAGRNLALRYDCAVLVKGGHAPGPTCRDSFISPDGNAHWFVSRRITTRNTHGTGCVLSAAIATELAHGRPLLAAIKNARKFLQSALWDGRNGRWGAGAGPAFSGV